MKKFLQRRFIAVCILICAILGVGSATATNMATRSVSGATQVVFNGATYTLYSHINYSSNGGVYAGASCSSSKAMPEGYMKVQAVLYDSTGKQIAWSDMESNASYNKNASATTENVTKAGSYYSQAHADIYDPSTGRTHVVQGKKTPYFEVD